MRTTHIFDFDGTLVDSMPYWAEKMLNILRKSGVSYPPDVIPYIATLGDRGSAIYFREELCVPYTLEEMYSMMDAYALPCYRDLIPIKDGVADYLQMLRSHGCSLNVLTASPHKMLDPCLKRLGIYDWFDHVWSTDDFGLTKSNPEIYLQAAAKLGIAPAEASFYDDNLGAIRTAQTAGMHTVAVYDPTSEKFTDEMKQTADVYARSMTELL